MNETIATGSLSPIINRNHITETILYTDSVHTIAVAIHTTVTDGNLLSELRECISCCTRAAMYAE